MTTDAKATEYTFWLVFILSSSFIYHHSDIFNVLWVPQNLALILLTVDCKKFLRLRSKYSQYLLKITIDLALYRILQLEVLIENLKRTELKRS